MSGIEGQLATSIGFESHTNEDQLTFLGDVTAIHDLNSFLQLSSCQHAHAVVILNNGGQIRKLPIGQYSSVVDPYMSTPHRLISLECVKWLV